ncbi:hypothetical protein CH260_24795 [Rhodococcus sp. 05-2256-B2]|nr:hypothetical protein CH258_10155 [Rhodococcus sp. 05-2256-B4]OZD89949.1 hypothetical protein CH260_24795 [Rhodococcus sp. 05-2256-B2]OZD92267.1 hypothetical protein CH257_14345 [Rhodococcus sp. 05-2256-B3]OZD98972.1 hypothetical protein CH285_22800 [Rhodococcus sp. 05-2256-B1]
MTYRHRSIGYRQFDAAVTRARSLGAGPGWFVVVISFLMCDYCQQRQFVGIRGADSRGLQGQVLVEFDELQRIAVHRDLSNGVCR